MYWNTNDLVYLLQYFAPVPEMAGRDYVLLYIQAFLG